MNSKQMNTFVLVLTLAALVASCGGESQPTTAPAQAKPKAGAVPPAPQNGGGNGKPADAVKPLPKTLTMAERYVEVEKFVKANSNKAWDEKINQVNAVATKLGKQSTPYIVPFLFDENVAVKEAARDAITRVGGLGAEAEPAIPFIARELKNHSGLDLIPICKILADMGPNAKTAIPAVIELLNDTGSYGNVDTTEGWGYDFMVFTIASIGPDALSQLLEVLNDKTHMYNADAKDRATKSIGIIASRFKDSKQLKDLSNQITDALIAGLTDSNSMRALYSVEALGAMGPRAKKAIPALSAMETRWMEASGVTAARTLEKIGAPSKENLPEIVKLLKAQSPENRKLACRMLGQMGAAAKEAIPALKQLIEDEPTALSKGLTVEIDNGAAVIEAAEKAIQLIENSK